MNFIYALCDPRDNKIRYVGKTDNPARRLKSHLREKEHCHRIHWLQSLVALGLKPTMNIIERVASDQNWEDRERFWIKYYRDAGYNLTNETDGGDCGPDMKGKPAPKSEQGRANIIAALVKRNKSPEMRAVSSRTGKRYVALAHTPEVIEKRRLKQIGKHVHSDEFKRALAERNKARQYNPETMRKNARKLWDDPVKGKQMRIRLSKLGRNRKGRKYPGKYSAEQNRINSSKLWDNPERAAIARAKLIERNKKNRWHKKPSPERIPVAT